MSMEVFGNPLVARMCEALGLKPDSTTAFTIEFFPDDLVRVRTNQLAHSEGIEQVIRVLNESDAHLNVSQRPFIPANRFEDIRARAAAGTLTNAERLALAVLAGGRDGEEGVSALIDAALEEYSHGSYRVPVRIIGDRKRLRVFLVPPTGAYISESQAAHMVEDMKAFLDNGNVAVVPAGWAIQAFETVEIENIEVGNPEGEQCPP